MEGFKHLLQGDLFPTLFHHHPFCLFVTRVLDEPEKVLLVHAGCCMDVGVYLNIMKVTQEVNAVSEENPDLMNELFRRLISLRDGSYKK